MVSVCKFRATTILFLNNLLLLVSFLVAPFASAAEHWQQDQFITDSLIKVTL